MPLYLSVVGQVVTDAMVA